MLEQVLDFIHNYFEYKIVKRVFSIVGGSLQDSDFLQEGQYFKIVGSVFNNGVWNTSDNLTDETFDGEVWCMAIPPRLIDIVSDIENWNDANKDVVMSPYQSESFGGYSYTKASGSGNGGSGSISWRDVFAPQLNQWRKIS